MPSFRRLESPGHLVHLGARLFQQALWARIGTLGVAPAQFSQLLALYEHDGLTQADLVELVKIDQSTMARTLARMERDGLITRQSDPGDKRRSHVLLTSRARAMEHELEARASEVNAVALDGLSRKDVATFMAVLRRIIENLDADARPAPRALAAG